MEIISFVAELKFSLSEHVLLHPCSTTRPCLCLQKQAAPSLPPRKGRSCLLHQKAGGIKKTAVSAATAQNIYLQNQFIIINSRARLFQF